METHIEDGNTYRRWKTKPVAGWGASDAVSPIRDGAGYHPILIGCKNTALNYTVNIISVYIELLIITS